MMTDSSDDDDWSVIMTSELQDSLIEDENPVSEPIILATDIRENEESPEIEEIAAHENPRESEEEEEEQRGENLISRCSSSSEVDILDEEDIMDENFFEDPPAVPMLSISCILESQRPNTSEATTQTTPVPGENQVQQILAYFTNPRLRGAYMSRNRPIAEAERTNQPISLAERRNQPITVAELVKMWPITIMEADVLKMRRLLPNSFYLSFYLALLLALLVTSYTFGAFAAKPDFGLAEDFNELGLTTFSCLGQQHVRALDNGDENLLCSRICLDKSDLFETRLKKHLTDKAKAVLEAFQKNSSEWKEKEGRTEGESALSPFLLDLLVQQLQYSGLLPVPNNDTTPTISFQDEGKSKDETICVVKRELRKLQEENITRNKESEELKHLIQNLQIELFKVRDFHQDALQNITKELEELQQKQTKEQEQREQDTEQRDGNSKSQWSFGEMRKQLEDIISQKMSSFHIAETVEHYVDTNKKNIDVLNDLFHSAKKRSENLDIKKYWNAFSETFGKHWEDAKKKMYGKEEDREKQQKGEEREEERYLKHWVFKRAEMREKKRRQMTKERKRR